MMRTGNILYILLCYFVVNEAQLMSPDDCQWMGLDKNEGAFIPVGVCKSNHRPHDDGTVDRHSDKYVCSDDGETLYKHVWGNNSFCEGDPSNVIVAKQTSYSCKGGLCPYGIIRFWNQEMTNYSDPNYECMQDENMWASALYTMNQCLNISDEWYSISCTPDGTGLMMNEYSPHCQDVLNSSILYEGCNYKEKYVTIPHCDYWTENQSEPTISTTETVATIPITTDISKLTTMISQTVSSDEPLIISTAQTNDNDDSSSSSHGDGYHHHGHHSGSSSSSHRHHEHDSHDSHDHNNGDDDHDHNGSQHEESEQSEIRQSRLIFVGIGVAFIVFLMFFCCMACKYHKQKQQIKQFEAVFDEEEVDNNQDDEGETTVVVEEGEPITFK